MAPERFDMNMKKRVGTERWEIFGMLNPVGPDQEDMASNSLWL